MAYISKCNSFASKVGLRDTLCYSLLWLNMGKKEEKLAKNAKNNISTSEGGAQHPLLVEIYEKPVKNKSKI